MIRLEGWICCGSTPCGSLDELEAIVVAATAVINERISSGCQACKLVCPFSAISFDEKKEGCRVSEALCNGCGACIGGCSSDAISLNHFTNEQIVAQMEGMLV